LRIPKFKLKRRNTIIRSIRSTTRRFQSQAAPLNNISMVNVSKSLRPLMPGMFQPCQIPLMDLTLTEILLNKNLFQHATPTNRLRVNARTRNPQLIHTISQQTMERVDGSTRVTLTMPNKNQFQHVTLSNKLRVNALIKNPLPIHMISQLITERVDGNTREILTMLKKIPFQHATLSNMPKVNAKQERLLTPGKSQPWMIQMPEELQLNLANKNQFQHVTLSSKLKANAPIRNLLLIHMISQPIMERVDGNTKVTLTTPRKNQSQLAPLNKSLKVSVSKNQRPPTLGMFQPCQTLPMDHMLTETLLNKTQFQHATPSKLLRVSAQIKNPLLIHMTFLLTMERVDGNTKVTLTMPRKNQSQLALLNKNLKESANKNQRPLTLGMSQPCQTPPMDHMLTEILPNKTQFQHATHSKLLRVSAPIKNLLLIHMIFQPIMERVDGNTKVIPTTRKKNPSQLAPLNKNLMVSANKNLRPLMPGMSQPCQTLPMDHMLTEILPNKTQSQHATPSRLLRVSAPIKSLLLIHMISQLITERVDGNIRVTPTMLKKVRLMSQDVIPMSILPVNARTKFLLLLHQLTRIQKITRYQTLELITTSRLPSPTWIMLKRSLEPGLYQRRRIRKLLLKSQRMLHLKRRVIQFAQAPDAQSHQRKRMITQKTTRFQTSARIRTSKTLSST
jgi:hypothetical protein